MMPSGIDLSRNICSQEVLLGGRGGGFHGEDYARPTTVRDIKSQSPPDGTQGLY